MVDFLPYNAMLSAEYAVVVCLSGCLSVCVCLSVTLWYCIKWLNVGLRK